MNRFISSTIDTRAGNNDFSESYLHQENYEKYFLEQLLVAAIIRVANDRSEVREGERKLFIKALSLVIDKSFFTQSCLPFKSEQRKPLNENIMTI